MWQLKSEISLVRLVTKAGGSSSMTGFKLKNEEIKQKKCRECRKHLLGCTRSGAAVVTVLSQLQYFPI